jgi:hypothetical protein
MWSASICQRQRAKGTRMKKITTPLPPLKSSLLLGVSRCSNRDS